MSQTVELKDDNDINLRTLPTGWRWLGLGELGLVRLGKTPRKADYLHDGEYKIVKFRDVDQNGSINWANDDKGFVDSSPEVLSTLKELKEGDVLVTASAHMSEHIGKKVGIVSHIPSKYKSVYVVGEILQVRVKEGVEPKWILYYLRSSDGYKAIQRHVHGVHLIASRAQNIEIPLAPPDQQRIIVAEIEKQFSRLDEAVANLKRIKANLKRYKATVLKAAVEGKLTEEWRKAHPDVESAAVQLKRILIERRKKWDEINPGKAYKEAVATDTAILPGLPEGWIWATLGQCFRVAVGATPSRKKPSYWNGSIPWVSSGEVQFSRIRNTREFISKSGLDNSSTQINPAGSVLLGMIGEGKTRGQSAILEISAANNQNCAALWVSETPIKSEYVYYWLMQRYEETRQIGSGNNQQALNKAIIESMLMPLPPITEINVIVEKIEQIFSVTDEMEMSVNENLTRAERLRQAYLIRAFSGRIEAQL